MGDSLSKVIYGHNSMVVPWPPRATIICDASWSNGLFGAAWHCNGERGLYQSETFGMCDSSFQAEMAGVVFAIHDCMAESKIEPESQVLIQLDNQSAIEWGPHIQWP